ncbi:MAG: hypothetical protein GY807_08800 [Gammaproteobacteria bacterium]|nr:hypothetical protein [Gammaproteobacteria bacterium]
MKIWRFFVPLLLVLAMAGCGFVDDAGEGLNEGPSVTSEDALSVNEQETVILDSDAITVSDDFASITSYHWAQLEGESVDINDADQEVASFVAPTVLENEGKKVLKFELTVTDNFGESASGTLDVEVLPVNLPPVANDDSEGNVTDEGAEVNLDVAGNDTDGDGTIDPTAIEIVSQPPNGSAVVKDDGSVSYTHDGSETTTDSFPYTVRDNEQRVSNQATVSISITPVNDPPEITGLAVSIPAVAEQASLSLSLNQFAVLDPDSAFPEDFTLKVSSGDGYNVSGTTVTLTDDNPGSTLTIPVLVNDGIDDGPVFNLSVPVTPDNDAPVITGQTPNPLTTARNQSLTLSPANLIISDPDDDDFTLTVQEGVNYTVSDTTITPAPGVVGTLSVPVTVNDGEITSNVFSVAVSVVNSPPVFTSTPSTMASINQVYKYEIVATDPDGDVLKISASTLPVWLVLAPTGNGTATLVGLPLVVNLGTHAVVLSVTDGASTPVTQSFSIFVQPAPTEAKFLNGNQFGCWTTPRERQLSGSLTDPQVSSTALYSLVGGAGKGTVTITDAQTGVFNYVPDLQGGGGVDSFTYRVDDPRGEVRIKAATVIIHPRLMFLGDSITEGLSDVTSGLPTQELRVGYRKPLYDALLAENYPIELVGSQGSGTAMLGFDVNHEGHPDWSAAELAYGRIADGSDGVFAWLERNPADIVLLHAGAYGLTGSVDQLGSLLDEIDRWERSANGNPVTVIVAQIIDQTPLNVQVQDYNQNLRTMVDDRVGNPEHAAYPDDIIVVDQYSALNYPDDLADPMHPGVSGYDKMAQVWKAALMDNNLLQRCQ